MTPTHGTQPAPSSDREILLEIRDNQRTTSTKLFGNPDAEQENPTGRLPKVERSAKSAHERIDSIEKQLAKALRRAVFAGVSATAAFFMGAVDLYMKVKGK